MKTVTLKDIKGYGETVVLAYEDYVDGEKVLEGVIMESDSKGTLMHITKEVKDE